MRMEFKKLYEIRRRAFKKLADTNREFQMQVEEKWGFHYADEDMDEIIDRLDCSGGLSYVEFCQIMDKKKGEKE